MAAGVIAATTPFCRACGWDFILVNTGDDSVCDSCGDTLAFSQAGANAAPTDLAAALGTDEVLFTWTEASDTSDIQYSIDGAAFILDDTVTSPYTVVATAVKTVAGQVRIVLDATQGPWSSTKQASSGQSPPTSLVATGGSLEVAFTFTADPAADTTDLLYDIDGGSSVLVQDVTTGVVVVAADGEVVSGQVRTVQDSVAGLYSTAESDTATA